MGDKEWLQLSKERLLSPDNKSKVFKYGPFEILENVGDNAYIFSLPTCMHIHLVVNVENMILNEPSMLDQEEEQVLCFVEYLAPNAQT